MMRTITIGLMALVLAGTGCDSSSEGSEQVTIEFAAVVGETDFACGETYDNLGADGSSLELSDFRFYVQELELKNEEGQYVPIALEANEWQASNVALLDFEDGCTDLGNVPMNAVVTGTVPTGSYDGLRFKMGVPFELNHQNPATAPSPLNLTAMQWDWQGGYKFLRIDSGTFSMTDWRMHLGSTGCDGDPVAGGTTSCSTPNRVDVELATFDPETGVVVADFEALVEGASLQENQPDTPVGCMAGPSDGDCGPLFSNLGLPFDGAEAGTQSFFSAR